MRKRRLIILSIIGILLFFFFVPIYRVNVSPDSLLPSYNECHGGAEGHEVNGIFPISTVYTSLSYVTLGHLITGSNFLGTFGLVYFPNDGWNTIQFPPVGFGGVSCS